MEVSRRTLLAGGLTAAALAGTAVGGTAARADPPAAPITPDAVVPAVRRLDGIVTRAQQATGVPGVAVAVVFGGQVLYAKGFGVRQAGAPAAVDADTVFQLASVSKPLSSTAISAAATRGLLAWSDPVRRGLPGFTLADGWVSEHVTLADLYSHRSGLPDHAGDLLEDLGYSQADILDRLRLEPLAPFRLDWNYTNYGLTAAGLAAAASAGLTFPQLMQRFLFGPLLMTSTSATFAGFMARTDRATLHRQVNGVWTAQPPFDVDRQAPAGGISSSVTDLARWVIMLLGQGTYGGRALVGLPQLLDSWRPQAVRTPLPTKVADLATFYGLGWNVDTDALGNLLIGHSGAFAHGAATNVLLVPATGLGIVTLTNGFPIGLPEAVNRSFLDQVEFGHQTKDWLTLYRQAFAELEQENTQYDTPPPVVTPSRPLSQYVGTYANPFWGPLVVSRTSAGLTLRAGPARLVFPLTHYTGDVFWFVTQGESANGQSGATFGGPPGDARTVTVQAWDTEHLGTFVRQT